MFINSASKSIFRSLSRNIILLGFVSLFTDLSSQLVFPLIPLFITNVLGGSAYIVGIIEGAAETTASFLKIISGYFSDKLKKRKPFVLLGYSLSSLTKPLFAFSYTWPFVLFIRVIDRVGKGLRDAPRDALIAESCPADVRGKAFGFQRAMDGIGSALGGLGAFLLLPIFGYRNTFLLAFFPGLIAILVILFIKEKKAGFHLLPQPEKKIEISFSKLPSKLKLFIVIAFLFTLSDFGYAFLILRAKNLGLADQHSILFYVVFYLTYSLFTIPAGILSDIFGRKLILLCGYFIFSVTSLGLILNTNINILLLLFISYGIFFALNDGVQRAYIVDLAPPHLKATALGTFYTAIGLAALPGGYILGTLWDKINPATAFTFSFGISLISFFLLLLIRQKK